VPTAVQRVGIAVLKDTLDVSDTRMSPHLGMDVLAPTSERCEVNKIIIDHRGLLKIEDEDVDLEL
jgi:hypothetical protein